MSNGTGTIILKYLLISILDCATFFFTGIQSLWNCLLVFLWFQQQKQVLCENQYAMESESASVQSDSKVWEAVQCQTDTYVQHISI